jgi:hypothetical protein
MDFVEDLPKSSRFDTIMVVIRGGTNGGLAGVVAPLPTQYKNINTPINIHFTA